MVKLNKKNNMEERFKAIEEKILGSYDNKYHNYHIEALEILNDLKYFKEHIKRTKQSKRFTFHIAPSSYDIYADFLEVLFPVRQQCFWRNNVENIIKRLKIFDITKRLFSSLYTNTPTEYYLNNSTLKDLIEWSKIIAFEVDIDLKEMVGSFIVSGVSYLEVIEKWNEIEKEVKTDED